MSKSRFWGLGMVCWFQGWRLVDRVAHRVVGHEHRLVFPVLVVGAAQQDADAQVDLGQVVGDELAVDHDARGHVHLAAPVGHGLVAEVAVLGVVEAAPAAEQDPAPADLLVAGQGLVEEVEQVVVHGHDPLHELHVAHQAGQVVGEQLHRGDRAHPARVQGRGVDVAALHQAEHLPGGAADLEGLAVELALQRVQRAHDVADGPVAVVAGVGGLGVVGLLQHPRVGLLDHALAVVDPDQVLLEDVVVEHVLGRLAQVDDPLAEVGRADPVGHVLVVDRAGGVVVPADAADAAGDEVGVAGVLALHEDRVAAEDRRGREALGDPLLLEVDLGVDPEAADDPGDRVPRHLDEAVTGPCAFGRGHRASPTSSGGSRWSARGLSCATSAPCRRSWP